MGADEPGLDLGLQLRGVAEKLLYHCSTFRAMPLLGNFRFRGLVSQMCPGTALLVSQDDRPAA